MATDRVDHRKGHRARLRDRMADGGEDAFADYELLEYILGFALRNQDTKPLAKRLIAELGSYGAVLRATMDDLTRIGGVGPEVAATIKFVDAAAMRLLRGDVLKRPVLGNWRAVEDYLHAALAHNAREQFRVLFLDGRNTLIADEMMSEGTINQTTVHIREVVQRALDRKASALILVHNHPSGNSEPSRDDIRLTTRIQDVCKGLDIVIHDHVIVGKGGNSSFKSLGLL
ncbi:MAG: DNA repair protein RadC [Pacificimonas sp.]